MCALKQVVEWNVRSQRMHGTGLDLEEKDLLHLPHIRGLLCCGSWDTDFKALLNAEM